MDGWNFMGEAILLEDLPDDDQTHGGILLAQNVKRFNKKGRVVAIGNGRPLPNGGREPIIVKVGDIVVYNEAQAMEWNMDGRKYHRLPEGAVQSWKTPRP